MSEDLVPRDELKATIAARKELGEDKEPALIDSFVANREEARGAKRSERAVAQAQARASEGDGPRRHGALDSLFALAAIFAGLAGVIVVCAALVLLAAVSAR